MYRKVFENILYKNNNATMCNITMQPSSYNVGYDFLKLCTHPRLMEEGEGGGERGTNLNIDKYRELFKNHLLKTAMLQFAGLSYKHPQIM